MADASRAAVGTNWFWSDLISGPGGGLRAGAVLSFA